MVLMVQCTVVLNLGGLMNCSLQLKNIWPTLKFKPDNFIVLVMGVHRYICLLSYRLYREHGSLLISVLYHSAHSV